MLEAKSFSENSFIHLPGSRFHILRVPGDEHIVNAIKNLLVIHGFCDPLDLSCSGVLRNGKLFEAQALIVPLLGDASPDLFDCISKVRSNINDINILGVALSIDCMFGSFDGLLDMAVSLDSVASVDGIKFFFRACLLSSHNIALQSFLNSCDAGYWIWDVNKDDLDWSDQTLKMTLGADGVAPTSISDFRNMIHPLDRARVFHAIENHIKYHTPYDAIEFRIRKSCGNYGDFRARGHAIRDRNGHATYFVGSIFDISNEVHSKRELIGAENKYSFLFYEMNEAAVLADVESGNIREVNKSAEILFGRSRSELLGFHQSMLHPVDLSDRAKRVFREHIVALIKNKKDSVLLPILTSSGVSLMAEISSSLVEIEGELCILGIFRVSSSDVF